MLALIPRCDVKEASRGSLSSFHTHLQKENGDNAHLSTVEKMGSFLRSVALEESIELDIDGVEVGRNVSGKGNSI